MFRRIGHRFAAKNMRHLKAHGVLDKRVILRKA
jgi:hypothetical protein